MKIELQTTLLRATVATLIVVGGCVLAQAAAAAKSVTATTAIQRGCLYLHYGCLSPAPAATKSRFVRASLKTSPSHPVCVYGAYICRIHAAVAEKDPLPTRTLLTTR